LVSAGYKLPTPISLVVEKGQELVLS